LHENRFFCFQNIEWPIRRTDERQIFVVLEMATTYVSTECWNVADVTAADDASENGSDAGDADNSADKDGLSRANSISSKLHIITNKVALAVMISLTVIFFPHL